MVQKKIRKSLFAFVDHLPGKWRDSIYRSRLNIPPPPKDLSFGVAETSEDLDQAFQILHDSYVKEGFSRPHESGRRITRYHILPSTTTLVAKLEEEVIATVTIIRDGVFDLPIDSVVDLQEFREKGERLGEVSSLAIKQEYRGRSGAVLFYLFKFLVHYSMNYFGIDRFLIVVNPSRRALYESILMFTPLQQSEIVSYEFANNAPGICGHLDLRTVRRLWGEAYKHKPYRKNIYLLFFGGYTPDEKRRLHLPERPYHTIEDPVMTPEKMNYFFSKCSGILSEFSDRELEILRCIYREKDYEEVLPACFERNNERKRAYRRFEVNCFGLHQGKNSKWTNFRVIDASRNGIRILTEEPLCDEPVPFLNVSVGEKESDSVNARLKWQEGCLQGLEILNAGPDWHRFIDYLENRRAGNLEAAVQNDLRSSGTVN